MLQFQAAGRAVANSSSALQVHVHPAKQHVDNGEIGASALLLPILLLHGSDRL
jgi:hypothetical protein